MEDEIITEKLPGAHKPENKGSTNVMRWYSHEHLKKGKWLDISHREQVKMPCDLVRQSLSKVLLLE